MNVSISIYLYIYKYTSNEYIYRHLKYARGEEGALKICHRWVPTSCASCAAGKGPVCIILGAQFVSSLGPNMMHGKQAGSAFRKGMSHQFDQCFS